LDIKIIVILKAKDGNWGIPMAFGEDNMKNKEISIILSLDDLERKTTDHKAIGLARNRKFSNFWLLEATPSKTNKGKRMISIIHKPSLKRKKPETDEIFIGG
jgi:hypothetical protein